MATLVLSAVGTALGGSIGGALGGLVGQSIDRGLLGAGGQRGPRLGDLSVQTSSYGNPIPRIFGTIRVAGTVVWATDLQEQEAVEGGSKTSAGQTGYAYSANMAVALSSRPIRAVRRIWADGKLIRGAAGDFKVKTSFRLVTGSEDQAIDPLIGSVETIGRTPAYRGIALAVFEQLELAEFGNRIPAFSFEIVAEEAPVAVGQLLAECSEGLVEADNSQTVVGYAAYGSSVADAIRPLVELFDLDLAERGDRLGNRSPPMSISVSEHELGCASDDGSKPRLERRRDPGSKLPASRTIVYHDPARDYQAGQMRASGSGSGQRDERTELPAVIPAEQAKQLVEQGFARRMARADRVRAWLPPARMNLRPGDVVRLPGSGRALLVQRVTIDGFAVDIEAWPTATAMATMPADPGRSIHEPDMMIGRTEPILIELPALGDAPEAAPRLCIAGSNRGQWKPVPVEVSLGSAMLAPLVLSRRAVSGCAMSRLHQRVPAILDGLSDVTVQLSNPDEVLLNADHDALMAGANLAVLGDELIQFGRAQQLGQGLFRLTKLLRGRRGTEWAASRHEAGEPFVVVDAARLSIVDLPPSSVGAAIKCTSFGIGDTAPRPEVVRIVNGEAMRAPAPCHLRLSRDGDSLRVSWVRRTHRGWAWVDGMDTGPDSFPERYRVTLSSTGGILAVETSATTASFELAAIPAAIGETINVDVAMIGPAALSRDISASITI